MRNKFPRYLAYAFGEILLVMIGILLALQVNNWNEVRKLKQQEQQLFVKILSDLQSNSIEIADRLVDYQNRQNLHYHLYNETKGKASYDSTLKYGHLRYYFDFKPLIKENYQPFIDKITNQKVRDGLITYFQREESALNQADQFLSLQMNFVRPYLTSNNISDIDAVFSLSPNEPNDPIKALSYEAMKAQFNTPEFLQVLYELRVKTAPAILMLNRLKEENSKLQKTVQQALAE